MIKPAWWINQWSIRLIWWRLGIWITCTVAIDQSRHWLMTVPLVCHWINMLWFIRHNRTLFKDRIEFEHTFQEVSSLVFQNVAFCWMMKRMTYFRVTTEHEISYFEYYNCPQKNSLIKWVSGLVRVVVYKHVCSGF